MSDRPDYDAFMENYPGRDTSQPNGVSEDENDWGHRSDMSKEGTLHHEERKSTSRTVNERKHGKWATLGKKDHGKEGHKASNENDDKLVE